MTVTVDLSGRFEAIVVLRCSEILIIGKSLMSGGLGFSDDTVHHEALVDNSLLPTFSLLPPCWALSVLSFLLSSASADFASSDCNFSSKDFRRDSVSTRRFASTSSLWISIESASTFLCHAHALSLSLSLSLSIMYENVSLFYNMS